MTRKGGKETGVVSVPLVRETRAGVQDNLHRGVVAVVSDEGKVLLSLGDAQMRAYIRSAAKPIQAIPVLRSGAVEAFGFDDADVAIVCGSHRGGPEQVAQVRSILAKAGIAEDMLQSGTGITDNCSGKHAGMLSACKHQGLDLTNYLAPTHPHQRAILETIAQVCGLAAEEIRVGIDGCGAPIHYIPVFNMALGYARMSRPEKHFDEATAGAVKRITRAMGAHAGGHTGEPEYAEVLGEVRLISKAGGSGVYCAGVVGQGIGFAMKVEDGSSVPLRSVFIEVMRRVGALSEAETKAMRKAFVKPVMNRRETVVGEVELLI